MATPAGCLRANQLRTPRLDSGNRGALQLLLIDLGIDARRPLGKRTMAQVAHWRPRDEDTAMATARTVTIRLAKRRRERPHPGAQVRFDDVNGYRLAFATNTTSGQLADLEVRHRSRARCEDWIRIAKDTGLANFPLKSFDQNRIWLAIVAGLDRVRALQGPEPG